MDPELAGGPVAAVTPATEPTPSPAPTPTTPGPRASPLDRAAAGEPAERVAARVSLRVRAVGCGRFKTGSGFVLGDGVLATNRHVVDGTERVSVNLWDGSSADGAFTASAVFSDLALVATTASLPEPAALSSVDPAEGDVVLVAGHPGGGPQTIVEGEVLGYRTARSLGDPTNVGNLVRIDAPIAPGSSGGPVLDGAGGVVGVIYAIERGADEAALAVPVSTLRRLIRQLEQGDESGLQPLESC